MRNSGICKNFSQIETSLKSIIKVSVLFWYPSLYESKTCTEKLIDCLLAMDTFLDQNVMNYYFLVQFAKLLVINSDEILRLDRC